jgi:hypothetical protein
MCTATFTVRHTLAFKLTTIAHCPGDGAGRLLEDEVAGDAVPDNTPADSPAMAGAHSSAVDEVNAAVWNGAVVDQQSGGPALVRFQVAVAVKDRVQDDNGTLLARLGGEVGNAVAVPVARSTRT